MSDLNPSTSRHSFSDLNSGYSICTKADIFQRTIVDFRGVNSIKTGKLFSIVGAVILAAVLLAGCLGGGGGTWIPKAGDFLEYTTGLGETQMTTRMTVKSITETTITMNLSLAYGSNPPYYSESTIPRNQTMGWTYDLSNLPSNYDVTKVGTETLSTKWGSRSADHYTVTDTSSVTPMTIDIWIRSGIAMKIQTSYMAQTMTMTLSDTNISQITSA